MDARVVRTRRSLQESLFALARERPLEELTVADIVQRAGVNRSSFYQHYADKDTLLADAIDTAVEQAGTFLPETITAPDGPPPRRGGALLARGRRGADALNLLAELLRRRGRRRPRLLGRLPPLVTDARAAGVLRLELLVVERGELRRERREPPLRRRRHRVPKSRLRGGEAAVV